LIWLRAARGDLSERWRGGGQIRVGRDGLVYRRDDGHEVSILIGLIGCVRGEQPGSNVSMMIMRPPQHGHGCPSVGGSSASAALSA
jgi:hypothetical protein